MDKRLQLNSIYFWRLAAFALAGDTLRCTCWRHASFALAGDTLRCTRWGHASLHSLETLLFHIGKQTGNLLKSKYLNTVNTSKKVPRLRKQAVLSQRSEACPQQPKGACPQQPKGACPYNELLFFISYTRK